MRQHFVDVNADYYGYENTHCLGLEIEEAGNCLTLALAIDDNGLIQLMQAHGLDSNAVFTLGARQDKVLGACRLAVAAWRGLGPC